MAFLQDKPELGNQYLTDPLLKSYLQRVLPSEMMAEIEGDLERLGDRAVGDIQEMGEDAERHEPELLGFNAWGDRVDEIVLARGWKDLKRVSAEEGLVAIGYERKYGELSRLYQFAKLFLFTPSSAIYTCPLAMTDGAARLIEVYGDEELKKGPYQKLLSRNPDEFCTSGQWMTEKTGGSDVERTETLAKKDGDNYRLYGDKWFTSAMPSDMTMTLARIVDDQGSFIEGSRGLSLFFIEVFDQKGRLNGVQINRLKDKLGTRALPTAELTLTGAPAKLMGEVGRGVKNISTLFNITRIYNGCCAVSFLRRMVSIVRDYSYRREAFKKKLIHQPLHLETLARLEMECQAAFHLSFYTTGLLGKVECGKANSDEEKLLRILTPLSKLYTAKQSIAAVSEALECMGGAGYLEDTGIPKYLRDTQTLSIWEGTTNVLSLDVLRSIQKEETLAPYLRDVEERLKRISHVALQGAREKALEALHKVHKFLARAAREERDFMEMSARSFAYTLSRTGAAALMLEHATWALGEGDSRYAALARWWCETDLAPLLTPEEVYRQEASTLGLWKDG